MSPPPIGRRVAPTPVTDPETPAAALPPPLRSSDCSVVEPWRAQNPWRAAEQQSPLDARLPLLLANIDTTRSGSTVVAQSLKQALTGAFIAPKAGDNARLTRALDALEPMLHAGRGPALEGLRELLAALPRLGVKPSAETMEAVRAALSQLENVSAEAVFESATALSERAELPPEAVRDVAQLAWLLNLGNETQRSEAVMRVLLLPAGGPMGALAEKAREVVLHDQSTVVTFNPDQKRELMSLMAEWPTASSARRSELMRTHAKLFNALERALGGAMVGATPGFASEQASRGNPLPAWLGDPRTTTLANDLAVLEGAKRELARLNRATP